jgi:ABC-type antimicrobial peptide transport system permease subunit
MLLLHVQLRQHWKSWLALAALVTLVGGLVMAAAATGRRTAAAIGYALATAVSRRRHELAVLRALGMTRRQTRLAVSIQATVLALAGLAFGIPLGLALGRVIWRVVAGFTPLAYHPPIAVWALLLIAPAALVIVNVLAFWPQRQAARLDVGQVLRTE